MTLPGWLVQQAHEDYIEAEKDFQEWLAAIEQQQTEEEYYVRPKITNIRRKRYYVNNIKQK